MNDFADWFVVNQNLKYYHDSKGKVLGHIEKEGFLWRTTFGAYRVLGMYINERCAAKALEESITEEK